MFRQSYDKELLRKIEPYNEKRGNGMKKILSIIISGLSGAVFGAGAVGTVFSQNKKKIQDMSDKHLSLFLLMNQWVKVKQEGKSPADYFEKNGYKEIAVYGMSYAGETLVNELKNTDIKVVYGIDKNADALYSEVDIVLMEDDLKRVDAVVVTAITFFDEIKKQLSVKMDCPIISLEDILYDLSSAY